jgi:hypothetical protein
MRPTSSRQSLHLQRWVLRLALLLVLAFAALVYFLEVEVAQLLRYLGVSLLFVGLAAAFGLVAALLLYLVRRLRG